MTQSTPIANVCGFVLSVGFASRSLWGFAQSANVLGALYISLHIATAWLFLERAPRVQHVRAAPYDVIAIASLLSPFAYDSSVLQHAHYLSSGLLLAGTGWLLFATISLGRSFGIRPAIREVRTRLAYRVVRHPIYASYLILDSAILIEGPSIRNISVFCIATALLITRLLYEERLLLADSAYQSYSRQVRYRLIPFVV